MRSLVLHSDSEPRVFGRKGAVAPSKGAAAPPASDELRLFAWTFAAGFVFVSIFLA